MGTPPRGNASTSTSGRSAYWASCCASSRPASARLAKRCIFPAPGFLGGPRFAGVASWRSHRTVCNQPLDGAANQRRDRYNTQFRPVSLFQRNRVGDEHTAYSGTIELFARTLEKQSVGRRNDEPGTRAAFEKRCDAFGNGFTRRDHVVNDHACPVFDVSVDTSNVGSLGALT